MSEGERLKMNEKPEDDSMKSQYESSMMFPIGEANEDYAKYFIGQSYLAPISKEQVNIFNVTFEPGCRNNWHVHQAQISTISEGTISDFMTGLHALS